MQITRDTGLWMQCVTVASLHPLSRRHGVQAQMEFKRTLERRQLREMQILMPEAFWL